jgi:glycerol-3-phosphate dehydrogenase
MSGFRSYFLFAVAASLSPQRWAKDVAALTSTPLDVLVVGGGIVGAGTALDAATRGLRVGLVEAQDWASGSSSRSSKLVHGGLRYLRSYQFALVHEALGERARLLRLAPHLVTPVPFVFPLRRPILERSYVGAGVLLYDLLACSSRATGGLPWQRQLARHQVRSLAPGLKPGLFRGAIRYYDAQVDDARFTLSVVRTAAGFGVPVLNRAMVTGLLRERGAVAGARLLLTERGEELEVRAKMVLSATGVWTERFEELSVESRAVRIQPSKGVHLLFRRECIESSVALILPTETSVLLVLPWGEHWLVGTTDTAWAHGLARPAASRADIDYLLSRLNQALARPLHREDVVSVFVGLRPLIAGPAPAGETAGLSREHAVRGPEPGLVVVSGGKFTTYRIMALDAVDAAVRLGRLRAGPSTTQWTEILGASGFGTLWEDREKLGARFGLPVGQTERLLRRYGGLMPEVVSSEAVTDPLGSLPGAPGYLRAEVAYAVTHEGARHLDDVLQRRTRLAMETRDRGVGAAPEVATIMAPLLGWDRTTWAQEVGAYHRQVRSELAAEAAPNDSAANAEVVAVAPLLPSP